MLNPLNTKEKAHLHVCPSSFNQSEKVRGVVGLVKAKPGIQHLGRVHFKLFENLVGKINGGRCTCRNEIAIGDGWLVLVERLSSIVCGL
jgi:hypothetical protein